MSYRNWVVAASLMSLVACGAESSQPRIEIVVPSEQRAVIEAFASWVPYEALHVSVAADPEASLGGDGLQIALVIDAGACSECYRMERSGQGFVVRGGAPLGIQYGLAHLLETAGFRFFQPWYTEVPEQPAIADDAAGFDVDMAPEKARRGLHLHTIHPTEPYYAFWETGEERHSDALRIADWVIKNRGNYVQWVGLDDIQNDPVRATAWREHTASLIESMNARGLQTGLGIQLFGKSNLQHGFDLIDTDDGSISPREEIEGRLPVILDGIGFDNINLSFGEFFGAGPQEFVDTVNLAYTILQEQAPGTEMAATIHVGDTEDLRVEYMNETVLYYFLVKFANAAITPWVHTVMFYNLFEDAGGAYHHDDFSEHRDFVFERLQADQPVGYFPETAYWIAFDVSVPIYLPLYVRSRWLDLDRIRTTANQLGAPDLDDHVIFSTAWEWGYWQNDYAALRASYTLPSRWESYFEHMFEPFGADGASVAALVIELAQMQHEHLLVGRLTQYFAGRDLYIDLGREIDIVSQPDRPLFSELVAMSVLERATFVTNVVNKLQAASVELDRISAAVAAVSVDGNPRWYREINDAVSVTAARGRYIHALFRAVITHADTGTDDGWLAKADSALAEAQTIVDRRHGDLHYSKPDELVYGTTNATYYQWGYLKQTHELCYWTRERVEVARAIEGSSEVIPSCVF